METAISTTTRWVLDPVHSELNFKVKHMMISNVKGAFTDFSVETDGEDLFRSPVRVRINASSISTGNGQRDGHLRSADFFDVENHREITFESIGFEKTGEDRYLLKGVLTMRGIGKEVSLDVEFGGINKDPWGNDKAGFTVSGKIRRKDWGLNWNAALEAGGVMVSEEVRISAEIQFVKQS